MRAAAGRLPLVGVCRGDVATIAVRLLFPAGVNAFSLEGTYANRLIRCYLGASRSRPRDPDGGVPSNVGRPPRSPDPVTGFDDNDDFPLGKLAVETAKQPAANAGKRAWRSPIAGRTC